MIERIVVPLDAVSENRLAIDAAVRLAARTKSLLHGVFVEDEELLHLASLPFARQVTLGGGVQPFTTESVEVHLRAEAERAQRKLFAAANRHRVKCSFQIVRGTSLSAVPGVSEHDFVVAAGLARPVAGHFRVERRGWYSIEAAPGAFLLARNVWSAPGSVVMLLRDRSPTSLRLFEAVAQVAAAKDGALTIICSPPVTGAEGFEDWVSDRVKQYPIRVQVEVAAIEPSDLSKRLSELDCQLLAFDASFAEASGDRLRKIVERFACDILIAR
jgi:nucleotide-binding universal stress UspA family protein